jgi:hypothetical protein
MVRGEDYVVLLDAHRFEEKTRIKAPTGPGTPIFSPVGTYFCAEWFGVIDGVSPTGSTSPFEPERINGRFPPICVIGGAC